MTFMRQISKRFESSWESRTHSVFIDDRGYESWGTITCAYQCQVGFLCRCKDPDSNGILHSLHYYLPKNYGTLDFFDVTVNVILTRSTAGNRMKSPKYIHLTANQRSDECVIDHDFEVEFRVCKIPLNHENSEYLIAVNLPRHDFPLSIMKAQYYFRWREEISFASLKQACCLNAQHALYSEPIRKEFWAKLILYNCTSLIAFHNHPDGFSQKETGRKHAYEVAFSDTVADVRYFLSTTEEYDVCAVAEKHLRPIRENRPNLPRKTQSRRIIPPNHRPS